MTDGGKLLLVLTFSNEFDNTNIDCFAFTKGFGKILLKSKWNTTFCIVPAENFWEQRNIDPKRWPCFFGRNFLKGKFEFHVFNPYLPVSGLCGCFSVNGTD